jgi:NDP-sugar pyrophosphorylase family protein
MKNLRKRISITLKPELLKLLDQRVDGQRVRNRSHAVELMLSESLKTPQVKALVLTGGKQIKLGLHSPELPKAMLLVRGRPLLEHALLRLKASGVTEIIISLGAGGGKIRDYFRDGARWNLSINYLEQKGLKPGTAQPLLQAQGQLMDSPFLLVYGDVYADINFADFLEFHSLQKNSLCTMALASAEKVSMWGSAKLVGSRVEEFEEKPLHPSYQSRLVNAGMYVMDPVIFDYITPSMAKLESELMPKLAEEKRLGGYAFGGDWYDISTPEAYKQFVLKMETH